jgi:hypothetical protein
MEYIIGITAFILGLILALVSTRKIEGSFALPLVATLGLMTAGVGLTVAGYIARNSSSSISFEGSGLLWASVWLPIVGLSVMALAMLLIALRYYAQENKLVRIERRRRDESVENPERETDEYLAHSNG